VSLGLNRLLVGWGQVEEVGLWAHVFEEYILSLTPFSLCVLASLKHLCSAISSYHDALPHHRPTAMEPADLGLRPL
jgi:hypothetical protein